MGLYSNGTGDVEISADTKQYIDVTTMTNSYKGRLGYDATNNGFKMHVN